MDFSSLENENGVVLLKTVSNSLFGTGYTFAPNEKWADVFKESIIQTVCPLSYDGIGTVELLPPDISIKWLSYTTHFLRNNIIINANHSYVDRLMKQHNIPYCILKGAASEYYYPNPSLRVMGDVDFLVPKEHFEKATEILLDDGFDMTLEDHECHRVFKKDKMHLEMHFEPAGMPEGKNREIIEEYFKDIFDEAKTVNFEGMSFVNPSPFHHGLIMLLHTYHHLLSEGVGLRHLCDWAVFVNAFSNDEFNEIFKEKLKKIGLWRFACILSATACDYLGLPRKKWIGNIDSELTKGVICDIFEGGNFGKKDKGRRQEGLMISDRGKDGVSRTKFSQLVKIKNKQAIEVFPVIRKLKFFYPFGFVFLAIRYLFNVALGKRKAVNVKKISSNADKRRNIYAQFELFKKEK